MGIYVQMFQMALAPMHLAPSIFTENEISFHFIKFLNICLFIALRQQLAM